MPRPAKKKEPKPMGRPRKPWNPIEFEKLCAMCATEDEICAWYDFTHDTLVSRCKETYKQTFSDAYKRFSAHGKMSVRRMQLDLALKGDRTMLVWLGKQMLRQTDRVENKVEMTEPLVVVLDNENGKDGKAVE